MKEYMPLKKSKERVRMVAEWEPHKATLLAWPHNSNTWPGNRLRLVEDVYIDILTSLLPFEDVHLLVPTEQCAQHVQMLMTSFFDVDLRKKLFYHIIPTNDCWIRDYGPITVWKNGIGIWTCWQFNAWGGKYPPWDDDNKAAVKLAKDLNVDVRELSLILEGGSVESNGAGTLITTESVLLNPNRNPERNKDEIQLILKENLGIETVIWLKGGIAGDDTDGHIDDMTRFISRDTIVTAVATDPADPNGSVLQENYEILKEAKDTSGNRFRVETLPMPAPISDQDAVDGSEYLPASYLNFYIANGIVLVPVFGQASDEDVLNKLRYYFPAREVVGIPSVDLVFGQGGIHCITNSLYGHPSL